MTTFADRMFRVKQGAFRYVHGADRPSSYPYISADSFRALADFVFDDIPKVFMPNDEYPFDVEAGDIVYVDSDCLHDYFKKVHGYIGVPYILIAHNGIKEVGEEFRDFIDDKVVHLFAKNLTLIHSKATPLPIGLENWADYGSGVPSVFDKLRSKKVAKKGILYHFKLRTNPAEREKALQACKRNPDMETYEGKLNPEAYLKKLNGYEAVVSPPGAGIDCHRTWEALYLGVWPIVLRTPFYDYFKSLGIPLWIVDSWDELGEMPQEGNDAPLFMDFWIDKISTTQRITRS